MENQFSRLELLIGKDALNKLSSSHVAIFGVGGVGGYVVESLARSGVSHFTLIDNDTISITNINRQIIATMDTIGQYKVDVMKNRILSINPNAEVETYKCFFLPESKNQFDFKKYDYIVDAVDTITAKIAIIEMAKENNVPVISSMGTGNKLNPNEFIVSDISKTSVCPLAKVMRRELSKRGIKKVKVVYSKEIPLTPAQSEEKTNKRMVPGSTAFVPSSAGLLIASEVVKDLIK